MDMLKTGWNFFQNEVVGMAWLNRLIGNLINACGLDATSKIGGGIQFFVYDTIKIMVLLGVLILIISYIQSYFLPAGTGKENSWKVSWYRRKYNFCAPWYGNAFLFLFFHSSVYRFYKCRSAAWSYFFFPDFFSNG